MLVQFFITNQYNILSSSNTIFYHWLVPYFAIRAIQVITRWPLMFAPLVPLRKSAAKSEHVFMCCRHECCAPVLVSLRVSNPNTCSCAVATSVVLVPESVDRDGDDVVVDAVGECAGVEYDPGVECAAQGVA